MGSNSNIISQTTVLKADLVIPLKDGGKIVIGPNGLKIVGTKQDLSTPNFTMDAAGLKGYDSFGNLVAHWETSTGEVKTYSGVTYAPGEIKVAGFATGLSILLMGTAMVNFDPTCLAEVRAKYYAPGASLPSTVDLRTADEGGTFADDGSTMIHVGCIACNLMSVEYRFTSAAAGRWYYEWRLRNSNGWSRWSDGNIEPSSAYHYVDTNDTSILGSGPPSSWTVSLKQGPTGTSFYVEATRPVINGGIVNSVLYQYKDNSSGAWEEVDAGTSASVVHYDGSAVDHTYNVFEGTLTKASGDYGDGALYGGLLLVDVRGGAFDVDYCLWATINPTQVSGAVIKNLPSLKLLASTDVRIKIVKPLNEWATDGYQGLVGIQKQDLYSIATSASGLQIQIFRSNIFNLPGAVAFANIEARVFFENDYSISNGGYTGTVVSSTDQPLTNELPLGVYTNFADGRYWERHPHPCWGIVATSNNVTFTFTHNNASAYNSGSQIVGGLRFRPAIVPDINGDMELEYGITNFSWPAYNTTGGNSTHCLCIGGGEAGFTSTDGDLIGIGKWGNNTGVSLYMCVAIGEAGMGTTFFNNTNAQNWHEARVRLSYHTHHDNNYMTDIHQIFERFNPVNNNWEDGVTSGDNPHTYRFKSPIALGGFHPFVGGKSNHGRFTGISGVINYFSVNKGIIIGDPGLVGQYQPDSPSSPPTSGGGTTYYLYSLTAK